MTNILTLPIIKTTFVFEYKTFKKYNIIYVYGLKLAHR